MNSNKKVWSIIMPAYNVEEYISIALDSVILQTVPSDFYEIIVIDDSSTDNTKKIIQEYQKKYHNIKLIESTGGHRWQSICWQEGLEEAKGRWLGFLDADDYLYPNALEEMTKHYIRSNSSNKKDNIICAWSQNEKCDSDLKHIISKGLSEDPYRYGSLINGMLRSPGVVVSHFLTCERERLLKIGGFDTSIKTSADRWLALKMDLHGKLSFYDKKLHRYRSLRPGSVTVDRRDEQIKYLSKVLNSALEERFDKRRVKLIKKEDNFSYDIDVVHEFKYL